MFFDGVSFRINLNFYVSKQKRRLAFSWRFCSVTGEEMVYFQTKSRCLLSLMEFDITVDGYYIRKYMDVTFI